MSEKIGRVDFSKEILTFLRLYNKAKGKDKKIQKTALKRIDRFLNIFLKTLVLNCCEMLNALKLVTLTTKILYIVYDITVNGIDIFTKETFYQFQNVLFREEFDLSALSYNNGSFNNHTSTFKSKTFNVQTKELIYKVIQFCGIMIQPHGYAHPKSGDADLLIEFILVKIFDASGDCDILTTEVLNSISLLPDFIKLDDNLGSFRILANDTIEILANDTIEL